MKTTRIAGNPWVTGFGADTKKPAGNRTGFSVQNGTFDQASAATRFTRRDILRAAVFL